MGDWAFDDSPCHDATLWWRLPYLLCGLHGGLAEEVVNIGHSSDPLAVLENVRLELSGHVACVLRVRGEHVVLYYQWQREVAGGLNITIPAQRRGRVCHFPRTLRFRMKGLALDDRRRGGKSS